MFKHNLISVTLDLELLGYLELKIIFYMLDINPFAASSSAF
jgi:hypothetical protein